MAAFKVGQRVRIKSNLSASEVKDGFLYLRGAEATIVGNDYYPYDWELDIIGPTGNRVGAKTCALEPILPPDEAADQFIARIKKLGSEPINDAPKVTVREGK